MVMLPPCFQHDLLCASWGLIHFGGILGKGERAALHAEQQKGVGMRKRARLCIFLYIAAGLIVLLWNSHAHWCQYMDTIHEHHTFYLYDH